MVLRHSIAAVLALLGLAAHAATPLPHFSLSDQRATIEYSATDDEGVVVFEAESDAPIGYVAIHGAARTNVLEVGRQRGGGTGISSLRVESAVMDLTSLRECFPAGDYLVQARSSAGGATSATVRLDHFVPRPVAVLQPLPGAAGLSTELEIRWEASPDARAYEVVLGQGKSDTLRVELPSTATSFHVPKGVLAPATDSHVEVGVVDVHGNRTLVEVAFRTR